jgi:membrane-associated protease RseP (regulator of RpoE activity)
VSVDAVSRAHVAVEQSEPPLGVIPPGPGRAALRLGIVLVAGIALAVALGAVPVLVVVLAIVAMIMLHELGHFATAKWSGMKVTEYFLGFGPRLWSVRRGETDYGVKAIPAGGYVRIVGMTTLEEIDPSDEPRSYRQASFPRRFAVGVAGSTMHFIIAFLLIVSYFLFVGAPVDTVPTVAVLGTFANGRTPAQQAGLRPGDAIKTVNGHAVKSFDGFNAYVSARAGKTLVFVVRRQGQLVVLRVTPVDARGVTESFGNHRVTYQRSGRPKGIIGIEMSTGYNKTTGPITAVGSSVPLLGSIFEQTFAGLGQVFSLHGLNSFANRLTHAGGGASSSNPGGSSTAGGGQGQGQILSILGAIQIGAQAASQDVGWLLLFLAEINIFIGVANLFPMLPLDGGHVAIAVYERVRSRRGKRYHADVAKLMPLAYVFLAFIVVIGAGALYLNIVHPAHLPGG